ncbi:MAG: response regulator transcription factor [Acidobacteria bacterium]|nr:response regulator transcription factor [Acidobacteriota bacterium]
MNKKLKLLVCDDHALFREGIKATLARESSVEVIGEAEDGRQAVAEAKKLRPNVVLMDIAMPGLNGLEATMRIKEIDPDIKILIMTMYDDEEVIARCLSAGASGYVLKDAPPSQLLYALEMVRKGREYLDPGVITKVSSYIKLGMPRETSYERLSSREREVLKLIAEGLSVKEIASQLNLSVKTVDSHKYNLMHKLDIHDKAGLIKYAIQNKVVSVTALNLPAAGEDVPGGRSGAA